MCKFSFAQQSFQSRQWSWFEAADGSNLDASKFFSRWQKGVNSVIGDAREYNTTACTVFVAQNRNRELVAESKGEMLSAQGKTLTLCSQRFCRSDRLIIG
ncbi:hypothetical protein H0G86_008662 [Trichoderma simmonsii]|uniref:Uncharacterized protein n=1 Tax=Trichoderma simmonsii TaxID=1491479 RepID=A0A8G0LFZ5_9HYPO|nr:hypothetical protein H0G86_008662 [Trichoderma simmonsii]